ncbi:hypothetical protein [Candidatus Lokiarchaeum ossiferum]
MVFNSILRIFNPLSILAFFLTNQGDEGNPSLGMGLVQGPGLKDIHVKIFFPFTEI